MSKVKKNKLIKELEETLIKKGVDIDEISDVLKKIENNLKDKKYGLVWEEHTEEIEKELVKKFPILKEEKELRIEKEDKEGEESSELTNNFLIEGDNLESLTALKNMGKKVGAILTDIPYNTGSDFLYEDTRVDKEDTYRHSKWVSFMDKRLKLTKEVMEDDSVMFINVDDNEYANLKLLCDSIFGEENVETLIWKKLMNNEGVMKISHRFRREHEYVLVIYKDKTKVKFKRVMEYTKTQKEYGNADNDVRGNWISSELGKGEKSSNPKGKNYFTIVTPNGKEHTRQWHYSKEEIEELRKDNRVYFGKKGDGVPRLKKFVNEKRPKVVTSILMDKGSSKSANIEITDIMGYKAFDYPKPVELLKYMLSFIDKEEFTVLDMFAGSGTLGQAVLDYNKENGTNHNFILCTNNENNICRDVTYERINKVINGYTTHKGKEVEGLPANLTYLKTELKDKEDNLGEFGLDESLIEHSLNNLKLIHNLSQETELIENVLYELEDNKTNTKYIIYNNFFIDEDELKNIDKDENTVIYVSEENLQDSNLLEFDEVRNLNDLIVYK